MKSRLLLLFLFSCALSFAQSDDCENATLITFDANNEFSINFDSSSFTASGADPSCAAPDPVDGWYKFVMPFDGTLTSLDRISDSRIAVYRSDAIICFFDELFCSPLGVAELVAGEEYIVQAFSVGGAQIFYNFRVTPFITNNECSTAEPMPAFDVNNETSLSFAGRGANISGVSPSCESNPRDAWYSFTMPFDGSIYAQEAGARLVFYEVDATNCFGVELACVARTEQIDFLTGGQDYLIQVIQTGAGATLVEATLVAAPIVPNDDCFTAEFLPAFDANNETSATGPNLIGASSSGVRQQCTFDEEFPDDAWYRFTMPFDGNICLVSSSPFTLLSIYESIPFLGECNLAGTQRGCLNPNENENFVYSLVGGRDYRIQVWKEFPSTDEISFTIAASPQILNDICADAEVLSFDSNDEVTATFDTNGASVTGVGEPSCTFRIRDGWYSMVSPITGSYQITGDPDTGYSIYEPGDGRCLGDEIACISAGGSVSGIVDGEEYIIRAYRTNNTRGPMTFSLIPTTTPVSNGTVASCEVISSITIDAASDNNNEWVPFFDESSELVVAINANGQDLGLVDVGLYVDAMDTRSFNSTPYARRALEITPANAPTSPVNVRVYILADEFNDLALVDPLVTTIDDISIIKQSNVLCTDGIDGSGLLLTSIPRTYNGLDYSLEFSTTNFSVFYPAAQNIILPVELIDFRGEAKDLENHLNWSTASEENSEWFVVERSGSGIDEWVEIGRVAAAGDSSTEQGYSFTDSSPLEESFYRLRILDSDGFEEFSPIVFITNNLSSKVVVYPNPASDIISVSGVVGEAVITNSTGQVVGVFSNSNAMDVSFLPTGVYVIQVNGKVFKFLKK